MLSEEDRNELVERLKERKLAVNGKTAKAARELRQLAEAADRKAAQEAVAAAMRAVATREALRSLRRRLFALDEARSCDGFVLAAAVEAQLPLDLTEALAFSGPGDLCRGL